MSKITLEKSLHRCVTDPVGPPPNWKNRPKICPRLEKHPEISSLLKTTLNSHPHWEKH